jgi:hypothetical protein
MTPLQQVNMFTAGLGEPLHTDVELVSPSNLQTAMSLTRAYEWRLTAATTSFKVPTFPTTKLGLKHYGSYQVLQKIGSVA